MLSCKEGQVGGEIREKCPLLYCELTEKTKTVLKVTENQ